jgi:hypothetical protein
MLRNGKHLKILVRQHFCAITLDIRDDHLAETYQNDRIYCVPCFFNDKSAKGILFWMQGFVFRFFGEKGEYRRIRVFICNGKGGIKSGKRFKTALVVRGNAAGKTLITENF